MQLSMQKLVNIPHFPLSKMHNVSSGWCRHIVLLKVFGQKQLLHIQYRSGAVPIGAEAAAMVVVSSICEAYIMSRTNMFINKRVQ